MNPGNSNAYNCLADVLAQKSDMISAKKCLEDGLERKRTKIGLRYYSIILRQTSTESPIERYQKAIDTAKEAVTLDLNDGQSWYVLGNSYCFFYFQIKRDPEMIDKALKAYKRAVNL